MRSLVSDWEKRSNPVLSCLPAIAANFGFADQAHMTRGVKTVTGRCPSAWRSARK